MAYLEEKGIDVPRLLFAEQQAILKNKLDERTKYAVLTSPEHPNANKNQVIAYDLAKNDWKFFVNNFVWLHDPEASDSEDTVIPFLLFDFQERAGDEIVKAINKGYDLPIEKSRKMGITWLILAILYWGWNFHKWDALVGSRKAEEVDKRGDMGTLFEKIRFMAERTPRFLFPKKFDHYTDKVMLLRNPINNATIVGEGNNPHFGKSDRRKVVFLDEFTAWEQTDRAAWQGLSATTRCRIPIATANWRGVNCWFYSVVKDYEKKEMPFLRLHWDRNPLFAEGLRESTEEDLAFSKFGLSVTSPWLEKEIRRSSDTQSVAQEILIDYEASMGDKVFADFKYETNVAEEEIGYDPNLPLYIGMDFGLDATAILWFQPDRKNGVINIIDEYQNSGQGTGTATDIYHYIDVITNKEYKSPIIFGDPQSGENRSLTASGQSNASILRRYGLIFKSQKTSVKNRIMAGRNLMPKIRVCPVKCPLTVEMFTAWQLHETSGIPKHNEYSHVGDSYTYYAWGVSDKGPTEKKRRPAKKYSLRTSGVNI